MSIDEAFNRALQQRRRERGLKGSLLLLSVIAFFAIVVFWAATTEIDDVTRTDGRIVPSDSLQTVQAPEAGMITKVNVRNGDVVEAGDLLVEMDPTQLIGRLDQERQHAYSLEARVIRLTSEVENTPLAFNPILTAAAPVQVAHERQLFEARKAEHMSELAVLHVQYQQQKNTVIEARSMKSSAENTVALLNEQLSVIQPLVERGLEPQTSLLQLEIQLSEWDGRIAQAASRLSMEQARVDEIEKKKTALQLGFRADALDQLSRVSSELAGLEPSFPVLEQRLRETGVRSPVAGIVNQVFISTMGGVLAAGGAIMEIVPIEDALVVEAFVTPAEIAFLYVGQSVNVKITAYDFSRYGSLDGELVQIGASPIAHPDRGDNVFVVEIATSTTLEDAEGQPLPIVPGMVAEVEFLSGKKTVLEYIVRPVTKVRERAFRD